MNTRKSRLAPLNLSLTVLYRPQDTRCLHRDKPHTRAFESCFPLFPDLRLCRVGHRPLASRAPRSRWCSLVGQHASGGSAGDLRRRSSKPPGSLCHHPSPGAARTRLGTAYLSRPHCDRPTTTTTMEALTSIAHDAAISPRPDSAAVVPGLAHTARAHPATIMSHHGADRHTTTTTTTATSDVLPASQESNISASSSTSYAPPLLSSQSNVSTESVVETELTSPATSNVSSQCPPSSQSAAAPANQEDNRPPRAVTPQPATTTSEEVQNASTTSPMAVDTPTISYGTKRTASGAVKLPTSTSSSRSSVLLSSEHSRNTSTSSNPSRIGQLSADLKTRLSYAMMKVQNGWEQKSIDELETVASSQRTSPATRTPTSVKFRNATDSPYAYDRRRRPSALSDPSDRYLGTPGAHGSPPGIRTFGPTSE